MNTLLKILAVAGLTVRAAVRSRVVALLAGLVVLCVAGLPLVIRSDGTGAGQVRLWLQYAFGLSAALMSVAAAWAAAGAVSLEVAGRQVHLLRVKPVHAAELWAGKWLGLMAINLLMLCLAGGLTYALLRTGTRPDRLGRDAARVREELLAAHSRIAPDPASAPPVAPGVRRQVVVPPAGEAAWQFRVPARIPPGSALQLRFQFAASHIERQLPVVGQWRVTVNDEPPRDVQAAYTPHVMHTVPIEGSAGRHVSRVTVVFRNVDEAEPATVLFAEEGGVRLRAREGGVEGNFLRALLLVLARLALFSALGLTAGALFSFPVAVCVAMAYLLLAPLSAWARVEPLILEPGRMPGWLAAPLNAAGQAVIGAAHWIAPPLARFEPLAFLPEGEYISWALVGEAWAVLALAYGGLLAALGVWLFSRRELGLAA